jgi:glyoxylase-like metal-dependent hydrolase (beta-lactamase superfamily II)
MASRDRWTFGATSLQRIVESENAIMPPLEIFADCTQDHLDEHRKWLVPRFQDPASGLLVITIQSFLVRQNGLNILVDTCGGNDKVRKRPHFHMQKRPWLDTLRKAGVGPEDIDIVLCTHLHVDHVGWNTRLENGRWVPTFPKARYLVSQREWDYWRNAGPAALERTGDFITDAVLPIIQSGQADFVGDAHVIRGDISLEPAYGHTPGQMQMRIGSGGGKALLCADLMHHPLQIRYPEWSTRFCVDPVKARQTRIDFLKDNANTGRLVFPTHFPDPTGGTIVRDGADFRFVYDGESEPVFR